MAAQAPAQTDKDLASISEARTLSRRAKTAQTALAEFSQPQIDSIVDATSETRVAIGAANLPLAFAKVSILRSTVIGEVKAHAISLGAIVPISAAGATGCGSAGRRGAAGCSPGRCRSTRR